MKYARSIVVLVLALAITVLSGVLQGSYARRWGTQGGESKLAERLLSFPESFATWTTRDSHEMSDIAVQLLQPSAYFNRRFVGSEGQVINASVILGAHGPISVHTPEICYSSQDYSIAQPRRAVTIKTPSGQEAEFWMLTMRSNDVEQRLLRVYYAWSTDGNWKAVESPRFAYIGQPHLFKFQMACIIAPEDESRVDPAGQQFLQDFVPAFISQLERS